MARGRYLLLLVTFSLLLSGCGGGAAAPTLPPPTLTPTPISTPLPPVATQAPFGSEDRPFRFVIVPPANSDSPSNRFQTYLTEQTGRAFEVSIVTPAEALNLLCSDTPAFGLVDGWTMISASLRGCAAPALLIAREKGSRMVRGMRSDILASAEIRVTGLAQLRDRAFCRVSSDDDVSWILPALMLRSEGIDPNQDLGNVRPVANYDLIVREIAFNQCVGAVPSGALSTTTVPGITRITAAVNVVTTSPELPFGGLVIGQGVAPLVAEQVTRLIKAQPDPLEGLIEANELVEASAADIASIAALVQQAGPAGR